MSGPDGVGAPRTTAATRATLREPTTARADRVAQDVRPTRLRLRRTPNASNRRHVAAREVLVDVLLARHTNPPTPVVVAPATAPAAAAPRRPRPTTPTTARATLRAARRGAPRPAPALGATTLRRPTPALGRASSRRATPPAARLRAPALRRTTPTTSPPELRRTTPGARRLRAAPSLRAATRATLAGPSLARCPAALRSAALRLAPLRRLALARRGLATGLAPLGGLALLATGPTGLDDHALFRNRLGDRPTAPTTAAARVRLLGRTEERLCGRPPGIAPHSASQGSDVVGHSAPPVAQQLLANRPRDDRALFVHRIQTRLRPRMPLLPSECAAKRAVRLARVLVPLTASLDPLKRIGRHATLLRSPLVDDGQSRDPWVRLHARRALVATSVLLRALLVDQRHSRNSPARPAVAGKGRRPRSSSVTLRDEQRRRQAILSDEKRCLTERPPSSGSSAGRRPGISVVDPPS